MWLCCCISVCEIGPLNKFNPVEVPLFDLEFSRHEPNLCVRECVFVCKCLCVSLCCVLCVFILKNVLFLLFSH